MVISIVNSIKENTSLIYQAARRPIDHLYSLVQRHTRLGGFDDREAKQYFNQVILIIIGSAFLVPAFVIAWEIGHPTVQDIIEPPLEGTFLEGGGIQFLAIAGLFYFIGTSFVYANDAHKRYTGSLLLIGTITVVILLSLIDFLPGVDGLFLPNFDLRASNFVAIVAGLLAAALWWLVLGSMGIGHGIHELSNRHSELGHWRTGPKETAELRSAMYGLMLLTGLVLLSTAGLLVWRLQLGMDPIQTGLALFYIPYCFIYGFLAYRWFNFDFPVGEPAGEDGPNEPDAVDMQLLGPTDAGKSMTMLGIWMTFHEYDTELSNDQRPNAKHDMNKLTNEYTNWDPDPTETTEDGEKTLWPLNQTGQREDLSCGLELQLAGLEIETFEISHIDHSGGLLEHVPTELENGATEESSDSDNSEVRADGGESDSGDGSKRRVDDPSEKPAHEDLSENEGKKIQNEEPPRSDSDEDHDTYVPIQEEDPDSQEVDDTMNMGETDTSLPDDSETSDLGADDFSESSEESANERSGSIDFDSGNSQSDGTASADSASSDSTPTSDATQKPTDDNEDSSGVDPEESPALEPLVENIEQASTLVFLLDAKKIITDDTEGIEHMTEIAKKVGEKDIYIILTKADLFLEWFEEDTKYNIPEEFDPIINEESKRIFKSYRNWVTDQIDNAGIFNELLAESTDDMIHPVWFASRIVDTTDGSEPDTSIQEYFSSGYHRSDHDYDIAPEVDETPGPGVDRKLKPRGFYRLTYEVTKG